MTPKDAETVSKNIRSPMIHVRLAGGLGNQLFQLAAAIALRGRSATPVRLETAGLRYYKVQRDFDMAGLIELPSWCGTDDTSESHALARRLMAARIGRWMPFAGVNDGNFSRMLAECASRNKPRTLWLDGYFQQNWDWAHFEAPLSAIAATLRPGIFMQAAPDFDCVIHVRGADFLGSAVHRVVDAGYYLRALDTLSKRAPSARRIRVVTDDRSFATPLVDRMVAARRDMTISFETPSSTGWLGDFMLMRSAPFRIIGNSTFSWWAAALDAQRAPTISPSQWTSGVSRDLVLPWETVLFPGEPPALSPRRSA